MRSYKVGVVAWSKPVGGFAVLLAPDNPRMVEGAEPSRDTGARMDFILLLRNVSKRTQSFHRRWVGAFQLKWSITDSAGRKYAPTFLPPPMPRKRRGPPPKLLRLAPGQAVVYGRLHGISGFRSLSKPVRGRWYGVLPAGSYTVVARGIPVGWVKGKLTSGPTRITVLPADRPVHWLKLELRADRHQTHITGGRTVTPVGLELTFSNVGKLPITLDVHDLEWSRLEPRIRGNLASSRRRRSSPPKRKPGGGIYILRPGKKLVRKGLQVPGGLGSRNYSFTSAGWYQIRLEYHKPGPAGVPPDRLGYWAGRVSSNVVWIKIKRSP